MQRQKDTMEQRGMTVAVVRDDWGAVVSLWVCV